MKIQALRIPDVKLLTPRVFSDARGFFMETFRDEDFRARCADYHFVQDNHSRSGKGILRGLHYQLNKPQGKLVRVTRGSVYDVAVDLRRSSPTFGQWVGAYLSDHNHQMLWIPPGFAHGFLVVSEIADFQYKCTDYFNPGDEHCLQWNDPDVGIEWPLDGTTPILSEKDRSGKRLQHLPCFD
ncbi:dTDP-4-dehydrorhamnose 3,5-epimerase [Pseudomonadota bacterium 24LQ007]